jgi:dipeptidyl aminopeptidase/acylaminoacyl peptidase
VKKAANDIDLFICFSIIATSENRLLIAHGQIDENVHFESTEILVSALVKYNKPHVLQPYPNERHGLRHTNVAEHFETLMFFWLINYL